MRYCFLALQSLYYNIAILFKNVNSRWTNCETQFIIKLKIVFEFQNDSQSMKGISLIN